MGALVIGTLVWLLLALLAGALIINHVGRASPLGKAAENQK